MSDAKSLQDGRERIARVFRYLKALNEHRNPAKRDLSEQPWTLWFRHLPDHPSIQRRFSNGHQPDEEPDYQLCQRNELRSLRIGGALRFQSDAVEAFLAASISIENTQRPYSPANDDGGPS